MSVQDQFSVAFVLFHRRGKFVEINSQAERKKIQCMPTEKTLANVSPSIKFKFSMQFKNFLLADWVLRKSTQFTPGKTCSENLFWIRNLCGVIHRKLSKLNFLLVIFDMSSSDDVVCIIAHNPIIRVCWCSFFWGVGRAALSGHSFVRLFLMLLVVFSRWNELSRRKFESRNIHTHSNTIVFLLYLYLAANRTKTCIFSDSTINLLFKKDVAHSIRIKETTDSEKNRIITPAVWPRWWWWQLQWQCSGLFAKRVTHTFFHPRFVKWIQLWPRIRWHLLDYK